MKRIGLAIPGYAFDKDGKLVPDLAAVSIRLPWADVVDEHDKNIRRIFWEMLRRRQRAVD